MTHGCRYPEITGWLGPGGPLTLAQAVESVTRKAAHRAVHGFGWSLAWEREVLGRHALGEVSGRGLRSVVAYTREDNVASRAVMSKLGMTYEKRFDEDGETEVLYRLMLSREGRPATPAE